MDKTSVVVASEVEVGIVEEVKVTVVVGASEVVVSVVVLSVVVGAICKMWNQWIKKLNFSLHHKRILQVSEVSTWPAHCTK